MAALPALSAIAGVLGSVVSAAGALAAGAAQQRQAEANAMALNYQARLQDQKAMEERATAQRKALDLQRQGKLALSKWQAQAAASGAGATDPTVVNLGGNLAKQTAINAGGTRIQGENVARATENDATLKRWNASQLASQGSSAMTQAFFRAGSSILGGASSAFNRFGGNTPPSAGDLSTPYGAFGADNEYPWRPPAYG